MKEHIEAAANLDALLIMGGENVNGVPSGFHRSRHAFMLYHGVQAYRDYSDNPLHIIIAGHHSGMVRPKRQVAESNISANYLIHKGVPEEHVHTETRSLDHLASMIYSRSILEDLPAASVGIVTDQFSMKRSLWAAKKVLPGYMSFQPLPTDRSCSRARKFIEWAVLNAWRLDLRKIKPGDTTAWDDYLKTRHPFHADEPKWSVYKMGVHGLKVARVFINEYRE